MKDVKKILVPIDFSANSEKLLEFAAFFVQKFGASLTLLNVIENPLVSYEGFVNAKFQEDMKRSMESKMEKIVEENKEMCGECATSVVLGDTVDTIIDTAKAHDLVIIGTHGYRGIEKILLGSVAERVVKRSPCPVLVFNPYK